jgi:hypothetical protein
MLTRKKPLKRSPIARKTRMKKVNTDRQAKRRQQYRAKLSAYRRSETYRLVEARAGGRCEAWEPANIVHDSHRCYAERGHGSTLTHHHLTYARFGGAERPKDIKLLCNHHNALAESQHPTRNRNYRKAS